MKTENEACFILVLLKGEVKDNVSKRSIFRDSIQTPVHYGVIGNSGLLYLWIQNGDTYIF
jgi:hypothetical protein